MNKAAKYSMGIMAAVLILGGCANGMVDAPETKVDQEQTAQITQEAQKTTKTYTNKKYGFTLEYPAKWEVRETEDNVIITANDRDDEWGGTNLNLYFGFAEGDVGLGKKTLKEEKYMTTNDLEFNLYYMGQDEEFAKTYDSKYDAGETSVIIGTQLMPGLKMFAYDKATNPEGEAQMKKILDSIKKI